MFFLNHRYTGALLLTAGILTQCIIGPIPDICENCCCCGIGPCIGAILSSTLAKIFVAFITLVLALCNFLGYFWIHMAAKSRTTENSQSHGSPNYCPPDIWYTAHVAVYGLFLAFAILTSRLFAFIYWNFILTEEKKRKRTMYFGPSSKNPALKNRRDPSRVWKNWQILNDILLSMELEKLYFDKKNVVSWKNEQKNITVQDI